MSQQDNARQAGLTSILGPDEDGLPIERYSHRSFGMAPHPNGTYVRYGEVERRLAAQFADASNAATGQVPQHVIDAITRYGDARADGGDSAAAIGEAVGAIRAILAAPAPKLTQHTADVEQMLDCDEAAPAPAAKAAQGWKLVPVEPTDEMVVAFAEAWFSKVRPIDDCMMNDAYAAMLDAAPAPAAQADEREAFRDFIADAQWSNSHEAAAKGWQAALEFAADAQADVVPSFDCSLAAIDAHDPQSFIDGAKWAQTRLTRQQSATPAEPVQTFEDWFDNLPESPRSMWLGMQAAYQAGRHQSATPADAASEADKKRDPVLTRRLQSATSAVARLIDDTNVGQPNRYVSVELLREMRSTFELLQRERQQGAE